MSDAPFPALFLGHGSPTNAIGPSEFRDAWHALGRRIGRPAAVLCLSAHWETRGIRVTSSAAPETLHDFYGFPSELFRLRYPAPGCPALAARVAALTGAAQDSDRGLDHGAWCVLLGLYPEADVPVLQLSLDDGLDASGFLALGRALAPLRAEGVLLLGSGNLVHNLGAMDWRMEGGFPWAQTFAGRVRERLLAGDANALADWSSLGPEARRAVPTREHFVPLLPILGARAPGEPLELHTDRVVYGSIGMTSVLVGLR